MSRLRFLIFTAVTVVVYQAFGVAGSVLFIDHADYVSEWSTVDQDYHLAMIALLAACPTALLAIPILAKRCRYLGLSAWWSLPAYGLLLLAIGTELMFAGSQGTGWAWLPFGLMLLSLAFGPHAMFRN